MFLLLSILILFNTLIASSGNWIHLSWTVHLGLRLFMILSTETLIFFLFFTVTFRWVCSLSHFLISKYFLNLVETILWYSFYLKPTISFFLALCPRSSHYFFSWFGLVLWDLLLRWLESSLKNTEFCQDHIVFLFTLVQSLTWLLYECTILNWGTSTFDKESNGESLVNLL